MNIRFYQLVIFIFSMIFVVSCKSVGSDVEVINGKQVDEKDYPTVVKIRDSKGYFICSGTIVSENVVLTAAHCLVDMEQGKTKDEIKSIIGNTRGVVIDGNFIKSSYVIFPEGFIKFFFKNQLLVSEKKKIDASYVNGERSRSQYESAILGLLNIANKFTEDVGVIIFEDNNFLGWKTPPFKSTVEQAKKKGKFFSLSKEVFQDHTVLGKDKKSVFFLGYGLNNTYDNLSDIESEVKKRRNLHIGYNSIEYIKSENQWMTPRPERGKEISKELLAESNIYFGDSGGPVIYNDKILGVSAGGYYYDCEGNSFASEALSDRFLGVDPNTGKKKTAEELDKDPYYEKYCYSSSSFASITLGADSKVAESFLEKVNKVLSELDLFKDGNNSIFKELLE